MPETSAPERATYRHIEIRDLDPDGLVKLSNDMKLSLSREDMLVIQSYYAAEMRREPTDVELEVIAQTWSEHCKHRIFGARISHRCDGEEEVVKSLFKTYIKDVTDEIRERKPGFVLAAFDDNAGFVKLDEERAICLKLETHNHPSAIEPYAGANTGLGGVIRDILGAGKGAKPVASLDIFCFGSPDTPADRIAPGDAIHPLGIMRGVVRGVRDYGNRMGIPTTGGAIQFDDAYIYNPLVFCGTAGVIPQKDIHKEMVGDLKVICVGGRTGRDGLHGATFSSMSLTTESHEEDIQAVQIGNPIEEKKACDFVLEARERGLIEFITDCGAGGFSSAAGEMLSEIGGSVYLERCPLKEPGLVSWEILLSESQERMVLAVKEEALPELQTLADTYETEMTVIGESDDSGVLKVWHDGELVCELNNARLHDAPVRRLDSEFSSPVIDPDLSFDDSDLAGDVKHLLSDFAIVSREPIIREYDHEVQGNTVLKPLAGAVGDAPQDASVVQIDGSDKLMALGLSILPEWGKTDPYAMGRGCVDECVRQLVLAGADPDRIALLDNFCVGDPEKPEELGQLVECVKGIASAALEYSAPFVSGKDSFYNYFETQDGPVSIPVTCVISGMGVVDDLEHVTGSSIRKPGSALCLLGLTTDALGGSVYARVKGISGSAVPATDTAAALDAYRKYHTAVKQGLVLSAHDVSEGGLAVTAAEMAFSMKAGVVIDLDDVPYSGSSATSAARLFSEAPSRILIEVSQGNVDALAAHFEGCAFAVVGKTDGQLRHLRVVRGEETLIDEDLSDLKDLWKNGLTPYY
ncbi:MAG: phosphoribosylformylglycinamidine synthase subunit PurL [Verrucomicrobiales bacterium]